MMNIQVARKSKNSPGIRPGKRPGTFRIQYYDWNGSHRTKIFNGSLPDAVKLRRSLLTKVDRIKNGLEAPPEQINKPERFNQLVDEFYDDYSLKVKSGSIVKGTINRHMQSFKALYVYDPSLENKLLTNISWKDFENFKIHRQSEGFSPHGINTNLRSLRIIFNYAVNKNYIKSSPLREVNYIKTLASDARYLTEPELSVLHSTLEKADLTTRFGKDAHDLVIFYLYTGARTSEALFPHFTWSCIDRNKVVFPKTKTKVSRSIPLTESIDKVLKSRVHSEDGPFCLDKYQVYKRTASVFNKADIKNASTHTLRKTAGAYYYMATRDIFATSRFLGHSSVKVTESHYVGLIQSLKEEYSSIFDELLSNRMESVL